MKPTTKYYMLLLLAVSTYYGVSKVVFDKVNETTQVVIDELFHLPQGLAYCQRNFSYWDPKITTLPGLYLVSTAFLGTYIPCNIYNLRLTNLIASGVNLLLFACLLRYVYGHNLGSEMTKIVLQAINLAILPPLYFFSHVYYTDTLSLMFLLALYSLCLAGRHKLLILILGVCSVLMRQTNIVWVALLFGHKLLELMVKSSRVFGNKSISNISIDKSSLLAHDVDSSKLKRYYGVKDVFIAIQYHLKTCFVTFFKFVSLHDWLLILIYSSLMIGFASFVILNGSIVVGDKKAHEATLHLPQMLYFLLFYGVFGVHFVFSKFKSTLKLIFNNKLLVVVLIIVFVAIVHYNTIVHPYLLADNRHYTFYVWNRWFGKYNFARYATIPIYIFLLFSLYDNLKGQNCISFLLPYLICFFAVLSFQKMIEVRYFLVPYIILRLRFGWPSYKIVIFEFLWYLAINAVTLNLFITKEIYWKDFDYAQRVIW